MGCESTHVAQCPCNLRPASGPAEADLGVYRGCCKHDDDCMLSLEALRLLVKQELLRATGATGAGWPAMGCLNSFQVPPSRTLFMNFLHTARISLASVAENIMTCLSWGVSLKMACTSPRMSASNTHAHRQPAAQQRTQE